MSPGIKYQALKVQEVPDQYWAAWSSIRRQSAHLASPFFAASLLRAAAEFQPALEVGVATLRGEPLAFLAWRRLGLGGASPYLGHLTDAQGPLVAPQAAWDCPRLLAASGLRRLRLPHVVGLPGYWADYVATESRSHYVDLSRGFQHYVETEAGAGAREIRRAARKWRKLKRDHGGIRFQADCRDARVLATSLNWKHQQLRRTRARDSLSSAWVEPLLSAMLNRDFPDVRGALSVLWLKDQPIAAMMGLRSGSVYHAWITAFDRRFASYSPGVLLLIETLRAAAQSGVARVDMGPGNEPYKRRFCNQSDPVAEVFLHANGWVGQCGRRWLRAKSYLRGTRWGHAAELYWNQWLSPGGRVSAEGLFPAPLAPAIAGPAMPCATMPCAAQVTIATPASMAMVGPASAAAPNKIQAARLWLAAREESK